MVAVHQRTPEAVRAQSSRVMLVDSDEVTLAGMTGVLGRAPDLVIAGAVASGEAALDRLDECDPDVVFIADRLPGMSGARTCAAILERKPRAAVVVLSVEPSDETIAAYLLAGARGFLTRGVQLSDLAAAARGARNGVCFLAPSVADRVVGWARSALAAGDANARLSPMDAEILSMVGRGLSNAAIARHIGSSMGTVKAHLSRIARTLGATRRSDAVAIAIRRGYIPAHADEPEARRVSLRAAPRERANDSAPPPLARIPRESAPKGGTHGNEGARASTTHASGAHAHDARRADARPANRVGVFVVDERQVVREGIASVLARVPGVRVVGESSPAGATAAALTEADPDVVLVRLSPHREQALDVCRAAADARLRARILVLAPDGGSAARVREALMWGAHGCLVGALTSEDIERAVWTVAHAPSLTAGNVVGWAELARLEEAGLDGARALDSREARIVRLMSEGKTNAEIADALSATRGVVKRQIKDIFEKLDVSSRAEAAAVALRDGVI
jgi:DNA-binding NarL/FixJ family response regulator